MGSPPPAGSKKVLPKFRSVSSMVMAPARTGKVIRCMIPLRLSFDLFEVGIGGQGADTTRFSRKLVPGGAAGVHDGLVIGEQPVREVALPKVEPDALDRVEVR